MQVCIIKEETDALAMKDKPSIFPLSKYVLRKKVWGKRLFGVDYT